MTRTERQELAINKWRSAGARNTIVAATGIGKTRIALMIFARTLAKNPNTVIRVIVPTKVLKDQWEERIEEYQLEGDIKVIVMNTAAKKSFYCDLLTLDEAHKCCAEQMARLFQQTHPKWILGLTATYERLDGREKLVLDKYCPVCDTITIEDALANGWLAPYKEYKVLIDVDLSTYRKVNAEFNQHFAFFGYDFQTAMAAATNPFAQQKIAKAVNCSLKEVKAHAYGWMRALQFRKKFIADHPKKIEIAKRIIEARKDKKIITFNTSIAQCKKYGIGYVIHSDNKKKENQAILEEFAHCQNGVIHSSKMLIEGLDCPGLSVAIMTGFTSSQCAHCQSVGRAIRFEPGKQAEVFMLVLRGTVEENWAKKAAENQSVIEINEDELNKVLNNENLDKEAKKQEVFKHNLLRF